MNYRECACDIRTFDPNRMEWKTLKTLGIIEGRRNHAAAVVDRTMVVYGGINRYGDYLNDVYGLNLRKKRRND